MTDLINGPDWQPKKPKISLPPLSCDTHAHLYGPFAHFPIDPDKGNGPDTSYKQYRDMLDVLGIERAVLVQAGGTMAGSTRQLLMRSKNQMVVFEASRQCHEIT